MKTLIEDMEKMRKVFLTNNYFSLCDEGEIDTHTFFKDSNELAKFVDKILKKMKIILLYNLQAIFICIFGKLKRVTRSDHGRGANEFNNIQEYKGINCYILNCNGCFLKCINYNFKKDFSIE